MANSNIFMTFSQQASMLAASLRDELERESYG